MMQESWEAVIGLEVHAQISSKRKLFSHASTEFNTNHNTQVSLVDAAMPGTLPILNDYCIDQAILTGIALSAEINQKSSFDRKNYFYPDLPQGYQITQFFEPIVKNGIIYITENKKKVRIARIHLEQDAGKMIHGETNSYIDLNRAGIALMEIVSEPDLSSSQEAAEFVKKLRQLMRYIGVCDGNMETGSLRCDINVSIRVQGSNTLGTRCEIKNLNSIRYIIQAIDYEIQRQIDILKSGKEISQDTLLFDSLLGQTRVMRNKENASDYRYFPEPDLFFLQINQNRIDRIKSMLPELPEQKKLRYIEQFGLTEYDANILTYDQATASYFEILIKKHHPKIVVSWLTVELFGRLNKASLHIMHSPITSESLSKLLDFIVDGTISGKLGKQIFDIMFKTGQTASEIIEEKNLKQITSKKQILESIENILKYHQDKVIEYKKGKKKLYKFFIGEVMKETHGKASPNIVNDLLNQKLDH
ncbi:Asp-tRNA(Asn)/Glu-tRNA(Gln) amidotransferase subunit GatB [Wolbachia endosymbiont of Howardula sp.]|uniref:Asp-tRNA(Asn)/Glu-tRNA(Gln) amidotransferase subunit GatB n=1 Tax=Wolbachia endosymbiont of Howardula sp. TaxID=2916816 RepID=UPI00217EF0EE|nr:Asp-tRNA(Asn)/Glu-tRNA(Gln) amidotransferase subunit GatB [Wolbachia endosymbiont of Howardula sp.]UWI83182.1 Asp-tRNA(Asn)/Glu-tRNA(Gln) amidotransferase subunit GatB [Wolbachia endosymbiont of Howardula sp.]